MKNFQRLEMLAASATLVAALLSFYFVHLPLLQRSNAENPSIEGFLLRPLLFYFFPAFLTFLGAGIHIVKQSVIGFIIILVFGGLLAFLHAVGFLVGAPLNGYVLLGVSPGLLATATIILALCSTLLALPQSETAKLR